MRYGMVIDLSKCTRCHGCIIACRVEHFLPPDVSWLRLMEWVAGEGDEVVMSIYPMRCQHCKNPVCIDVCPTGANQQSENGIVWIDQKKCVGCRYCVISCPYQARTLNTGNKEYFPGRGLTGFEKAGKRIYPHQAGTAEKCNFCKERVETRNRP